MKMAVRAAGLAAMLASAALLANETEQVLVETDARAIVAQQQEIRSDAVARTGRYKDMDERTRTELLAKQDRVFALLEGRERSTDLPPGDQTALFNSLESISAIVNNAEDERMVCERIRPTGSNMSQNVCKTVAQRRAEREAARQATSMRNVKCRTSCRESQRVEGW
ncbi:hypothetical protein QFW77_05570 [Luteimonas sp. RD2P54]|uniref:Uncharacterized protein n=1 Tax=Luteimonas endophytica TaxID=3042023 RepID=A0ABT6J8D5_9GAMM|nr:hypothetical protein [Luteimonas endophytica]MDH5822458.1 hypothetical protein [Luteimonas endophytica]